MSDTRSGTKTWRTGGVIAVVTFVGTIVGMVFAAGQDRSEIKQAGEQNAANIRDHEVRIRAVEFGVGRIETDVSWIRSHLENARPRGKQQAGK